MKAAVYTEYGPPEVLAITEVARPEPGDGDVLVRVYATVVTSGDVRLRKADPFLVRAFNGLMRPKNTILGINFAGVVAATGAGVKEFRQGDGVFGSTESGFGAYAEYVLMPQNGVIVPKPAAMTYEEAAVVPFGALTSWHFLRKADIRRGQKVLIYGASGSLGVAAVQLAKHLGAHVTGVCSTRNLDLVMSLGADEVIDYTREDFTTRTVTYDVIYDTVGKCPYAGAVGKLTKRGVFLNAVLIPPLGPIKALWTQATTSRKVIGGICIERREDLLFLAQLIEAGTFRPVIDRTYPLERIAEAHQYVEQGHKRGNVAITVAHPGE